MTRILLFCILTAVWSGFTAAGPLEDHPGYLDSVAEERHQHIEEMVLVSPPDTSEVPLREVIFDERLSEEFQTRYEDEFGPTEAERNFFAPNRFDEYEYDTGLSVSFDEDRIRKQRFAEYMMRRLAEHHVDGYFKSNPDFRPVYELKDKISKLNVEVKKGFKVRLNYSYSGNYLDIKVENPLEVDTRVRMQMEEGAGPSEVKDTIVTLGYSVSPRLWLGSYLYSQEGRVSLITSRALAPGVSVSLTGTTNYRYSSKTAEGQNLVIVGLGWTQ